MKFLIALLLAFLIGCSSALGSYAGLDYEQPNGDVTGCGYVTWLTESCYPKTAPRLSEELQTINTYHLGNFQRLWVSEDQLFRCFDATTGFCGFNEQAVANLDDALSRFAVAHIVTDLVLFDAQGNPDSFRAEAVDGYHPEMEANYVRATRLLLAHIAANPTEAKAVAVVDLFNEAYYQLLQKLAYKPNTCNGPEGGEACFNEKLVHPFLRSLYSAGKEAAPRFLYTVSATSDLFSEPSPIALYSDVADVYDVHLYSGSPWDAFTASYLSRGKSLGKPWFVGEAGCATSTGTGCSYDGGNVPCVEPEACSLSVDSWWLAHLQSYGAFAVMVQNASAAYSVALEPSLVGKRIAQTNQCAVICRLAAQAASSTPPHKDARWPLPRPGAARLPPRGHEWNIRPPACRPACSTAG